MLKIGNNSKIKETAQLGETQVTRFFFFTKIFSKQFLNSEEVYNNNEHNINSEVNENNPRGNDDACADKQR